MERHLTSKYLMCTQSGHSQFINIKIHYVLQRKYFSFCNIPQRLNGILRDGKVAINIIDYIFMGMYVAVMFTYHGT